MVLIQSLLDNCPNAGGQFLVSDHFFFIYCFPFSFFFKYIYIWTHNSRAKINAELAVTCHCRTHPWISKRVALFVRALRAASAKTEMADDKINREVNRTVKPVPAEVCSLVH